jgi:hypothetical protein
MRRSDCRRISAWPIVCTGDGSAAHPSFLHRENLFSSYGMCEWCTAAQGFIRENGIPHHGIMKLTY